MRSAAVAGLLGVACSGGVSIAGPIVTPPAPGPPATADITLYTTLDSPGAVATPTLGSGSGALVSTSPVNDFVNARVAAGLRTDAVGERVLFPQTDGQVQNVELERGTIEFWYRPDYNHDDNLKYTIVGTGTWQPNNATRGSIHLGKHNHSNQNALFLIFFDANAVRWEHDVAVTDYSWKAGDWLLFRLTWDFGVPAGVQNMHLYVNGQELRLGGQVSRGRHTVPAEQPGEMIYIGSRDLTGPIIADGLYDEVKIWNKAVPPN